MKGNGEGSYKQAAEFIRRNRAATLSTVMPDGRPHNSVVYCVVHDDLNIYFTTRAEGRKFDGLAHNPEVCLMFMGPGTLQQLQLSGRAKRLHGQGVQLKILHELMKLRYADTNLPKPGLNLLEPGVHKEYAVFRITPYEMTYIDFETPEPGVYKPVVRRVIYHRQLRATYQF